MTDPAGTFYLPAPGAEPAAKRWENSQAAPSGAPVAPQKDFTLPAPAARESPTTGEVAADVGKSALTQGALGTADIAGTPHFLFGDVPKFVAHKILQGLDSRGMLPANETPDTLLDPRRKFWTAPPDMPHATANPIGVEGMAMDYPYIGAPSSADVGRVEKQAVPALNYEPKYWQGKVAGEGARMAVSAAGMGGPGTTLERAGIGALAGGGSELAGELFEGSAAEPYARAIAAIVTPTGWHTLQKFFGANSEVTRQLGDTLRRDQADGTARMTPEQVAEARARGLDPTVYDYGGSATDELLAKAGAATPQARAQLKKLNDAITERTDATKARSQQNIRDTLGMTENAGDLEAKLKAASKAENKKLYDIAEANPAADTVTSPRLSELSTYEPVKLAMERAKKYAQDPQFNIRPPTEPVSLAPSAPPASVSGNLPYWHQVQVEFGKLIDAAKSDMDVSRMTTWHNDLKNELNRLVPEYATATSTAREGFGATDAIKAGYGVLDKPDTFKTAAVKDNFGKLSSEEQELFAQGVGQKLAEKAASASPKNFATMLENPATKDRLVATIGQDKYDALYGHARSNALMHEAETIQATARSGIHLPSSPLSGGLIGAGVGAIANYLPELPILASMAPDAAAKIVITGTLGAAVGTAKYMAERKIAPELLKMVQSSDPKDVAKFGRLLQENPAANALYERAQSMLENYVLPAYRATTGGTDAGAGLMGPAVGQREGHAAGGAVGNRHATAVVALMKAVEHARKRDAERTKPLLMQDDSIVAHALASARSGI